MSSYVNINGQLLPANEAALSADNSAFRYGFGLFETVLFQDGAIQLKELHWERLFAGMQQLHFDLPRLFSKEYLEEEIKKTVQKNELERLARVRLQVFAGNGGVFGAPNPEPEFVIECFPLEDQVLHLNDTGLVTGIAQGLKKSNDTLSNLKSCNALIYVAAAQQAKTNNWDDALLLNTSGNIIESTIANIFWIKDQTVYTPPLSEGCIAGVMRSYIIAQLQRKGFGTKESPLSRVVLGQADSIFLTNAIRRIKWVQNVDNHSFSDTLIRDIYHSVFHKP